MEIDYSIKQEKAQVDNVLNWLVNFSEQVLSAKTTSEVNKIMFNQSKPFKLAYTLPNGVYTANEKDLVRYIADQIIYSMMDKLSNNRLDLMTAVKEIVDHIDKIQIEVIDLSNQAVMNA